RIPHQPQWSNATDLVRKDTAPAGAVPAHEHLNRKLNLRYDLFTSADYVACLLKHSGPAAVAEPSSLCNARSCTGFSDAGRERSCSHSGGRRPKAPGHEVAGSVAPRRQQAL